MAVNQSTEKTTPAPLPEKPEEKMKKGATDLLGGVSQFFGTLIDLKEGMDREGTIINIKNNKRMQGANAWLLMCSIMIASLGLDLNSPAIIIGAMLISPLMSPILGIGLAIGINDRTTLGISAQHFLVAIAIAIITSTLYFLVTPFGDVTPEIESRTAPTLLDVMVAFFGGVAGIISGSRKDKSNAIPGVAIATALMPPLCVTGFGLATGNWKFMLNSFYLFFLNATFVALATYLIVRYLKFPQRAFGSRKEEIRTRLVLFIVSILLIAPSAIILMGVLKDIRQEKTINKFVEDNFENAICEVKKNSKTDTFDVKIYIFDEISRQAKENYTQALRNTYKVEKASLNFFHSDISMAKIEEMQASQKKEILDAMEANQKIQDERDILLQQLNSQVDSLTDNYNRLPQVKKEVTAIFSNLENIDLYLPNDKRPEQLPMAHLKWKQRNYQRDEERLVEFLRVRMGLDTLVTAH